MLSNPTPELKEMLYCAGRLKSTECRCGKPKQRSMAFCRKCFWMLPQTLRLALYRKIGNGFEAAYRSGCEWLAGAGVIEKKEKS